MTSALARVGRLAAVLGLVSVGLHVLVLSEMAWASAVAMLFAALACLACTVSLWRGGGAQSWAMVASTSFAMLVLHGATMLGAHRSLGHLSTSDHLAVHARGEGWDLMHVASAVAGVELLVAVAALVLLRAGRRDCPRDLQRNLQASSLDSSRKRGSVRFSGRMPNLSA